MHSLAKAPDGGRLKCRDADSVDEIKVNDVWIL